MFVESREKREGGRNREIWMEDVYESFVVGLVAAAAVVGGGDVSVDVRPACLAR